VFAPGDEFVSAIYEAGAAGPDGSDPCDADDEVRSFERLDTCPSCFEKVERPAFSRWLTRLPLDAAKQPLLDLDMARDFLVRLCREANPERRGLIYVLALLLLRKRRVKLEGQRTVTEGEATTTLMDLTVKTGEADEVEAITVPVCELSEEETAEIERELGRLFGLA
jgi:hypothetical protein